MDFLKENLKDYNIKLTDTSCQVAYFGEFSLLKAVIFVLYLYLFIR